MTSAEVHEHIDDDDDESISIESESIEADSDQVPSDPQQKVRLLLVAIHCL